MFQVGFASCILKVLDTTGGKEFTFLKCPKGTECSDPSLGLPWLQTPGGVGSCAEREVQTALSSCPHRATQGKLWGKKGGFDQTGGGVGVGRRVL